MLSTLSLTTPGDNQGQLRPYHLSIRRSSTLEANQFIQGCLYNVKSSKTLLTFRILLHALHACAPSSEFSFLLHNHNEDIYKCFCYMLFMHVLLHLSFRFCFITTIRTFITVLLHALHACAASSEFSFLLHNHNEDIHNCFSTCSSCMCCFI